MLKDKILVLGSTGLLGSRLSPYLKNSGFDVITHSKNYAADYCFDLADWESAKCKLSEIEPTLIINLVALTSVENCETNMQAAYLQNICTVENITRWIRDHNSRCHLIQLSTDHVYDGTGPHDEEKVHLTNIYALTKYAGELAAGLVPSTIIRTNFVGKSLVRSRESMTDWIYNSLRFGRDIQVMSDVLFSPLSIETLMKCLLMVIELKPVGIFNIGSNEGMSKADFDFIFAKKLNLPLRNMLPVACSNIPSVRTYRPKDMRMDCTKFEILVGMKLPSLNLEIDGVVEEYGT